MIDLEKVRRIQWGFSHNWDIAFPDPKDVSSILRKSFLDWLPAIDVEFSLYNIETNQVQIGSDYVSFPKGQNERDLSITFADNEDAEIENWLDFWVKSTILNLDKEDYGVSPLSECCKLVIIQRLNSIKESVKPYSFLIYPINSLPIKLDSKGDYILIQQSFKIASDLTDIIKII